MNALPEKDDARGQAGEIKTANHNIYPRILAETLDAIKAAVMNGNVVAPSDFPHAHRPIFWAAVKLVRDELPNLKPGWRTLEERHVDGIRVRERIYRLRGAA